MLENNILSSMESSLSRLSDISIGKASMYGIKETQYLLDAIEKLTPADILAAANYAFASPPVTSVLASQKTLEANNLK
jgi:predicted Zn-dependent peptidase